MEFFGHIKTIISMILGIAIGRLLNESVKFIQHPGRVRYYWIHLLWSFYLFLVMIHFWWWEYTLNTIRKWSFTEYLFVVMYTVIYFLLSSLQYPADVNDYANDFRNYYYSRRKWFFSLLSLSFLVDIVDTLMKGHVYFMQLMPFYAIKMITHLIICLCCIFSKTVRLHVFTVIYFILFEVFFIITRYYIQ